MPCHITADHADVTEDDAGGHLREAPGVRQARVALRLELTNFLSSFWGALQGAPEIAFL